MSVHKPELALLARRHQSILQSSRTEAVFPTAVRTHTAPPLPDAWAWSVPERIGIQQTWEGSVPLLQRRGAEMPLPPMTAYKNRQEPLQMPPMPTLTPWEGAPKTVMRVLDLSDTDQRQRALQRPYMRRRMADV